MTSNYSFNSKRSNGRFDYFSLFRLLKQWDINFHQSRCTICTVRLFCSRFHASSKEKLDSWKQKGIVPYPKAFLIENVKQRRQQIFRFLVHISYWSVVSLWNDTHLHRDLLNRFLCELIVFHFLFSLSRAEYEIVMGDTSVMVPK